MEKRVHLSLPGGTWRGFAAFALVLAAGALTPAFVTAQSKSEAQLIVRIQDLETQIRTLTGQVEGLQFSVTQLQTQLQKMQDDNEYRFQQLEGGAGKKSDAATQSTGVTPDGALPQASTGGEQAADAGRTATGGDAAAAADESSLPSIPPTSGEISATTALSAPMDDDGLGDSGDPLVGTGGGATPNLGESRPLNLGKDGGQALSDGKAAEQYKAGYDAVVRGDYAVAEQQFRQFLAMYPKDPEAPDASNWLGEALLQRGNYDDAADVLLTAFQNYQSTKRAPDLLLKLGIALAGAGEGETACRTFKEVTKRYPNQPAAFNQKLAAEEQKAQCPA